MVLTPLFFCEETHAMAITVEQLAREILGSLDMEDGYLIAQQWISRRYQELANKLRLKHLQKLGEVIVPGRYNTGLVSVTRNSQAVTGSGTLWGESLAGRYFKRERNWYVIESVPSASALILATPYAENTTLGVGYNIAPRVIALPAGVRQVEQFISRRGGNYLTILGSAELDLLDPIRDSISDFMQYAVELGSQENSPQADTRLFEFYPYPVNDTLLSFLYYQAAPDLALDTLLPEVIDPHILKEGAMIDAFRFAMAKALKDGRVDVAALWRNEMRAQETAWEKRLVQVAEADRASDPGTVILTRTRGGSRGVCN
jgi:hypothetical protein